MTKSRKYASSGLWYLFLILLQRGNNNSQEYLHFSLIIIIDFERERDFRFILNCNYSSTVELYVKLKLIFVKNKEEQNNSLSCDS